MKVGLDGKDVTRGNLAQGVVCLELSDNSFYPCTTIVESPEVEGHQSEICNQCLVVILAELEQRKLLVRLIRLGPLNNDEAVRMGPAHRLVSKFGCLHTPTNRGIMQVGQLAFDGLGELGHNDKWARLSSSHSMILWS